VNSRRTAEHRTFAEHWTDSRKIIVLDGSPETIHEIASGLSISPANIVRLTSQRALLALWEESFERYLGRIFRRQLDSNRHSVSMRACYYSPLQGYNEVRNDSEPKA
jgi:hypothetical protein